MKRKNKVEESTLTSIDDPFANPVNENKDVFSDMDFDVGDVFKEIESVRKQTNILFATMKDFETFKKAREVYKNKFKIVVGKDTYIGEKPDEWLQMQPREISFMGMRNLYSDYSFNVLKSIDSPHTESVHFQNLWLKNPYVKKYKGYTFDPNKKTANPDLYNVWKGFVEPKKGDVSPFLNYLTSLCANEGDHLRILQFLAHAVQFPHEPSYKIIQLKGPQGVGKSFLGEKILNELTPHYLLDENGFTILCDSWNDDTRFIKFYIADETTAANCKDCISQIKSVAVSNLRSIRQRQTSRVKVKNILSIISTSDQDLSFYINTNGERRLDIIECSNKLYDNHDYFSKLHNWVKGEGKHYIIDFLMNYDITDYEPRKAVKNVAQWELQLQALKQLPRILVDIGNGVIDNTYTRTNKAIFWEDNELKISRYFFTDQIKSKSSTEISRELNKIFDFDSKKENWSINWKNQRLGTFYHFDNQKEYQEKLASFLNIPVEILFKGSLVEDEETEEGAENKASEVVENVINIKQNESDVVFDGELLTNNK